MDKRWIYILIILIIGLSALYYIASSSDSIGQATVDVNTFVITLPDSFNIDGTDKATATLINRNTGEKLTVQDFGKGNHIKEVHTNNTVNNSNNENIVKIDNDTIKYHNITIYTVYMTSSDNTTNATSYFMKFNHTFTITACNFKNHDSINNNVKYIIEISSYRLCRKH